MARRGRGSNGIDSSLAIIILGGVGGPFHSAAVAVFSKLIGVEDKENINRLYNTFLTSTFIINYFWIKFIKFQKINLRGNIYEEKNNLYTFGFG